MLGAAACSALISLVCPQPSSAMPGYCLLLGEKCCGLGGKGREAHRSERELLETSPRYPLQLNNPKTQHGRSLGLGAGQGELGAGSPSRLKNLSTVSVVRAWDSSPAESPHPLSQAFIWHQSPECRGARERGTGSGPDPSGLVRQVPGSKWCPQGSLGAPKWPHAWERAEPPSQGRRGASRGCDRGCLGRFPAQDASQQETGQPLKNHHQRVCLTNTLVSATQGI